MKASMLVLHHAWRSSASRRVRLCIEEKGLTFEGRVVNAYDRASMRNWMRHVDERIGNLIIFNWRHSLQKVAEKWTDEELAAHLKKIPSKERQEAWLRVARRPYTEEERAGARGKLVELLDRMERTLEETAWLAGKRYTIADIAVVPFVKRIEEEIASDQVTAQFHPRVTEWWQSIQARPAFKRANIGPFIGS